MAFIFISDMWNTWNIRGVVMLSLLLQVLLILFAPLRKKIANNHINWLLWLVYLMADSVVVYGIGLISHNQGNPSARGAEVNGAVQALWASFLLLHLGGPDTITAFSLEDSSLWKRHLLSLIFQVGAAIYVFVQIFPTNESLVIPTMLVFSLGVIKNVERILALHLSSLPRMRESMIPLDFDRGLVKLLSNALDKYEYSNEEAKLAESIVVEHAYMFFQVFKVFLVDLIYTLGQRKASVHYFDKVSPLDALRVISVELQFMYEMLHTKALAIRSKWSYIFRFVALNVLAVAFILFNRLKKHHLSEVDIKITYSLLCGGIALDVMALFMLVFSDWTAGVIKRHNRTSSRLNSFLDKLVSATDYLRKPRFAAYEAESDCHSYLDTPLVFRRWSESISACNLLSEIMEESPRKTKKCNRGWINIAFYNISSFLFRMAEKIASSFRQTRETVVECCFPRILFRMAEKIASSFRQTRETVVECCFPRIRFRMAEKIASSFRQTRETVVARCFPREESMITHAKYVSKNPFNNELWIFIFAKVKRKSNEIDDHLFAKEDTLTKVSRIFAARGNLFLKSISTELREFRHFLHYTTDCDYESSILYWHIATEWWYRKEGHTGKKEEREFSKILSDYMFYLLLNQPTVMFAVAGTAQFTIGEILRDLRDADRLLEPLSEVVEKLCRRRKAREGFRLAQELGLLGDEKWEVMSGVWVEMLCYAAGHIRGESHAQVLSKGGELLAFVWLLMAHFGCLLKDPWGPAYDAQI